MTDIANMAEFLAVVRRMSIAALVVGFSIVPGDAQLSLAPLSAAEIENRLFGQRVVGEYSDGQRWAENLNPDGSSQYAQDGELTPGSMHFEDKRLCFTYDPREMIGGCFEIWPRGANCFDFYARKKNTLPPTLDDKRFGRAWDARAWVDGKPSTCQTDRIS